MVAVAMATVKQFSVGILLKIMPITSKTGLLPSVRKSIKIEVQRTVAPEMPKIAIPAPFTLRPFAGVYNPFPYGCSILCNHPADFEAKTILKRAKEAWAAEGKSLLDSEEFAVLQSQQKINELHYLGSDVDDRDDKVPEELFRKYTDTDSRPVTPAPTMISVATKETQNLRGRRCVTPDPTSFIPTKEKTLLVLDLRRSQSQETVCWQGGQVADSNLEAVLSHGGSTSRTSSPSNHSLAQGKRSKTPRKRAPPSVLGTTSTVKTDESKNSDTKTTQHSTGSPSKGVPTQGQEIVKICETSPEQSSVEADFVKRRGKKRKGKKTGKDKKEGEKGVQGIPDPNETQMSALENDSRDGSSRASSTGEEKSPENRVEEIRSANQELSRHFKEDHQSFLNEEILKQLQRQLDQEVVDSELNEKRKMALEEALRCKGNPKHVPQGEEMKVLKKEFQLSIKNPEKWLSIPRVFTRRSARFELPLDCRLLNNMTPLEYVQNYVFASPERLVLYNHVFNMFKEEPEDDEETDRILLGKNVVEALGKIMGRPMTTSEAKDFQDLIDWKNESSLDFRTFTGIGATCERLLGPQFCSKMPSQEQDPRHEVERADFESLDGKLLRLKPDRRLVQILKSIRDL